MKSKKGIKNNAQQWRNFQSEIPKQYSEENSGQLKCNTDIRKTSSVTRAWKRSANQWNVINAGYKGSIEKQYTTYCLDAKI